jgi:hypothetical protein
MLGDGSTMPSFAKNLDILFRSKIRLLVLVVLLPAVLSGVNFYLWRSYEATEVVFVDDPNTFGQGLALALGYNPYQTPAQNAAKLFSNLLGTQTFNNALADKLTTQGVIHSDRERASLITSLSQLTVTPGGAPSGGGSAGGGSAAATPGDRTVTLRTVCSKEYLCLAVLPAALDVYQSQYQDLKARAAATARGIYEANLKAAEAEYAAAIAAMQKYVASLPKTTSHQAQTTDPIMLQLQHDLDSTQKAVDDARAKVKSIDTLTQVTKGLVSDMFVVDGPRTQKGLYGIKGLRNEHIKTAAIAFGACLVAGIAYVILVAFLDRAVRNIEEIKNRFDRPVIAIPSYESPAAHRRFHFFKKPA